jgi:hypothetical protein
MPDQLINERFGLKSEHLYSNDLVIQETLNLGFALSLFMSCF